MNGDTATCSPTTPVDTVSSGTHSDGSASARPSGNSTHTQEHVRTPSDSHSDSQSDNSVNDYRATFLHPTNQKSDCVSVLQPSHCYYLKTLLSLTQLSRVTLTLSHFSTQSHNSTQLQLIHSLRSSRAPANSVTCRSHARPAAGRSTQSAKTKETDCQARRSTSEKTAGQRSLYAKTVIESRKFARD